MNAELLKPLLFLVIGVALHFVGCLSHVAEDSVVVDTGLVAHHKQKAEQLEDASVSQFFTEHFNVGLVRLCFN